MAEGQVIEAMEENLPEEEEDDWNWDALAKLVNGRWNANLRDRDLKKAGRDGVTELLLEQAHQATEKIDLGEGARFLEPDYGIRTACGWVHYKFGIELPLEQVKDLETEALIEQLRNKAREAYELKEAEYPVMAGLYHFTTRDASGQKRYDRDQLVAWARDRFHVDLDMEDLKNKQRDDIRALLIDHSRSSQKQSAEALADVQAQVERLFVKAGLDQPSTNGNHTAEVPVAVHAAKSGDGYQLLIETLKKYDPQLPDGELGKLNQEQLHLRAVATIDEHFRPEMRRLERNLVLQILDAAWKEHLLTMDHLRSSVSLRGYAQIDPKVEYKREGMQTFEAMWNSIGDRVTDLIFRMEQLDENFVGSTWKETSAIHEEAPTPTSIGQQQQSAIDNTQGEPQKLEPIRNRTERVGRNDPCPCGSGKKFKNCCMRKGSAAT